MKKNKVRCEAIIPLNEWNMLGEYIGYECQNPAVCEIRISQVGDYWEPRCGLHNGQRRKYVKPKIRPLSDERGEE